MQEDPDLMMEYDKVVMDSDAYLDDWFLSDYMMDHICEMEYKACQIECGVANWEEMIDSGII